LNPDHRPQEKLDLFLIKTALNREKTKRGGIKSFSRKTSGSPKNFPKQISNERELKRGHKGFERVEVGV